MVVRRWNAGFHVNSIARDLEVGEGEVVEMLIASGIDRREVERRMTARIASSYSLEA